MNAETAMRGLRRGPKRGDKKVPFEDLKASGVQIEAECRTWNAGLRDWLTAGVGSDERALEKTLIGFQLQFDDSFPGQ
ncbi:MAG TPA: hypothetical protein VI320_08805 [Terracidiphilus sp.]